MSTLVTDLIRCALSLDLSPLRAPVAGESPADFLTTAILRPFLEAHLPAPDPDTPSTVIAVRSHEDGPLAYCAPGTFNVWSPHFPALLDRIPAGQRPYVISAVQRVSEAVRHVSPIYTPRWVSEVLSRCGDWNEWQACMQVEFNFDPAAPVADERAMAEEVFELLALMRQLRAYTDHDHHPLETCLKRVRHPLAKEFVRRCRTVIALANSVPNADSLALRAAEELLGDTGGRGARVAFTLGFSYGHQDVALEALSEQGRWSMEVGEFPPVWAARLDTHAGLAVFVTFVRAYRALDAALVDLARFVQDLEEVEVAPSITAA